MTQTVWILRESFLAYERFHGVFATIEAAKAKAPGAMSDWWPITRTLPMYMGDAADPFNSAPGAESKTFVGHLWVVEPKEVES